MQNTGYVILVGAGPGDPGLLTLRGKQALQTAEVVLYDRLAGEEVLSMIPEGVELVDVGKSSGHHPIPQSEINAQILRYAREGKRVVRLKGGDPYLFGRGAEELEAVVAEGIPFEVVPGVTSAIAAPAYGGIPVSHRDMASSIHIITGHSRRGAKPAIPYRSLAELDGTLIFLMGVGAIEEITGGLMDAGMDMTTPAALIENGTHPKQRRLLSTLSEIAARAAEENYRPPSVLLVGKVCSLADSLDWYSRKPLSGVRVLVTRPKASASELVSRLRFLGCAVTEYPCIRTKPLPVEAERLTGMGNYDWLVFTSPVGVEIFFDLMKEYRVDIRVLNGVKLGAVGAKTASGLEAWGLLPDFVPESYNAGSLAAGLAKRGKPGERVLLFRAQGGTPMLPEELRDSGFLVEDLPVYETLYENPGADKVKKALEQGEIDYITFTSASTVRGFAGSLPEVSCPGITCVCIGEETATEARKHGFLVKVSQHATMESMIACIAGDRGIPWGLE